VQTEGLDRRRNRVHQDRLLGSLRLGDMYLNCLNLVDSAFEVEDARDTRVWAHHSVHSRIDVLHLRRQTISQALSASMAQSGCEIAYLQV
jgi:hypothetical protein